MLAVKVLISTTSQDSGIGIIQYVHSLIGLKDNHVSKRDVDNQFWDIFNSLSAVDGRDRPLKN